MVKAISRMCGPYEKVIIYKGQDPADAFMFVIYLEHRLNAISILIIMFVLRISHNMLCSKRMI